MRDLDELRIVRTGVCVPDDQVAVRKLLQGCNPEEADAGKLIIVETSDDRAHGVYLYDTVIVAATNQSIPILKTDGTEDVCSVAIMTALFRPAGEIEFVGPHDSAGLIVLPHDAIALVCNEVVAIVELSHKPRIAVGVRMVYGDRRFVNDIALAVYLDNAPVACFGNHRQPVLQPLEPVDLDARGTPLYWLAVPLPDQCLWRQH